LLVIVRLPDSFVYPPVAVVTDSSASAANPFYRAPAKSVMPPPLKKGSCLGESVFANAFQRFAEWQEGDGRRSGTSTAAPTAVALRLAA